MLEADNEEYLGDPMQYALDTKENKADWLVPKDHEWIHTLRSLGFRLEDNHYDIKTGDDAGKHVQFYSAERNVTLKSGEVVNIGVSAYEQPSLRGHVGINIEYLAKWRTGRGERPSGIYGSTPIPIKKAKRVLADMIRRLEQTEVEYDNTYTQGVERAVNTALKKYEYWENNRESEDTILGRM